LVSGAMVQNKGVFVSIEGDGVFLREGREVLGVGECGLGEATLVSKVGRNAHYVAHVLRVNLRSTGVLV
jgi:hypothetical protein